MSAYNLINGVHAANNRDLCMTVAREEWGFEGVIMSDWNTTVPEDGSVPPKRHGITTNTYMPQVRPVLGLFELLKSFGKKSTMYYAWEPIRDISRPESLAAAEYIEAYSFEHTDEILTNKALEYIEVGKPDFVFIHMVETDEKGGHDNGWMSKGYLDYLSLAIDNVKKIIEKTNGEYTVIVTADHGGHDRFHGTDMAEDMTIPMFFVGKEFEPAKKLEGISILDLAPTISEIVGVPAAQEWEGVSVLTGVSK